MILKKHKISVSLRRNQISGYIFVDDTQQIYVSPHFIATFINTGGSHVLRVLLQLYPTYHLMQTKGLNGAKLVPLSMFYNVCLTRNTTIQGKVIKPEVIRAAFPTLSNFVSFFDSLITAETYVGNVDTIEETPQPQEEPRLLPPASTHSIIKDRLNSLVNLIEVKEQKLNQAKSDLDMINSLLTDVITNLLD